MMVDVMHLQDVWDSLLQHADALKQLTEDFQPYELQPTVQLPC